ncbi:MAG: 1-acyl-sn-glycerol-3-phosphate acyltransferase [Clostridia bacterium]|nr:1-acyl-sn-glycerol-3-phosphate acyltransferase [Clostridia bacterium]
MMISFFNAFVKITAWPVQWLCFRTKVIYEDKSAQSRRIKGAAIIVSNHTSVFDYAVYLFVFFTRTLRFQMAEVLFKKKLLGLFLKCMGGIFVDRDVHDLGFIARSESILDRGGVVGVFPEGRLPRPGEERPLPFKIGAAYLALSSGVPIIPVYTNGSYFNKKRAKVVVGAPFFADDLVGSELSDKEKIALLNDALRRRIIELGELLNDKTD